MIQLPFLAEFLDCRVLAVAVFKEPEVVLVHVTVVADTEATKVFYNGIERLDEENLLLEVVVSGAVIFLVEFRPFDQNVEILFQYDF